MLVIYNLAVCVVAAILRLYGRLTASRSKLALFAKGQVGLIDGIERRMQECRHQKPMIWFHAASLGEYAVARPIIKAMKAQGDCEITLTFFSSTGYMALKDKPGDVDYLFYLPLDTRRSARRFLDAVKPDRIVWIVSEYWLNYFSEIRRRGIAAYLVSAKIRESSVFFRWYGRIFRRGIAVFTHFFVLDEPSQQRLASLGYDNATVSGNPLFDNAVAVATSHWEDSIIERFSASEAFVAGSVSDEMDELLVATLANRHRDTRFIIVPHEPNRATVERIRGKMAGRVLLYSECDGSTDVNSSHVMVVDTLGSLARIYRYARWAYVGGGFTRYLHSLIEATVYGIPVSFGPCIQRKVTPRQIMQLGIGQSVATPEELDEWFTSLKADQPRLDEIRQKAYAYMAGNVGSTDLIVRAVREGNRMKQVQTPSGNPQPRRLIIAHSPQP